MPTPTTPSNSKANAAAAPVNSGLPLLPSTSELILWPEPPGNWTPQIDLQGLATVHLWALNLDVDPLTVVRLSKHLAPAEMARASRFRFEVHRNRYVAGRALMRTILSRYLGPEPGRIELVAGSFGKPALGGVMAESGIQFNLAHCEGLGVLGIAHRQPIGVDLEQVRFIEDADDLVAQFFSPREARLFSALPAEERTEAFFNLWTRKEALLKAVGQGIGRYLNQVEVAFLRGEAPQLLALPPQVGKAATWRLHCGQPVAGFVTAVACNGPVKNVECRKWPEITTGNKL